MSDTRKQVGSSTPKMLFCHHASLLMIVSTIEHLTTPLFPSQIVRNQLLVTKGIIIHPLTEYLSNDINQCGTTSCHTCNIFINDQFFKSNLIGREYKTISYDRLSCGSTNVIYGIHCVHCGLVYVGETGSSLISRINGHRSAIKKEDKAYSTDTSINQIILWMT